jgi:hypothetical protein
VWGALSLLLANIAWPIIIFPFLVSRLFASFLHGHSRQRRSFLNRLARGIIGLVLVVAAFVAGVGLVGMFGPFPHEWFLVCLGAGFVVVAAAFAGAFAEL